MPGVGYGLGIRADPPYGGVYGNGTTHTTGMTETDRLRVDKWLWHARFCKSRSVAADLAGSGHLRINKEPCRKPGQAVKVGDVLTFPKGPFIRVIEVVALGTRRGPAVEAQTLYTDLDPPENQPRPKREPPPAQRDPGAGRPTKKDRRQIDRLRGDEE